MSLDKIEYPPFAKRFSSRKKINCQYTPFFSFFSLHVLPFFLQEKKEEVTEDNLDWWSKFFASIGDEEKSAEYVNKGYAKMTVIYTLYLILVKSN